MSYDFDDHPDYPMPPPARGVRAWIEGHYWSFVLWCALDSKSKWLAAWGQRCLFKAQTK